MKRTVARFSTGLMQRFATSNTAIRIPAVGQVARLSTSQSDVPLPDVFGDSQFELKYSVRANYNVTKEPSVKIVNGNVVANTFKLHPRHHKPLEVLRKNKKAYERAKEMYEEPLVARGFVKYFDQLEEKFPWVLENLIRNDGEYIDSDNSTNLGMKVEFDKFVPDQQNTKATLTVTEVSKLFSFVGDESETGLDQRLTAFDTFAQIVGPRYNPMEDVVTMSCEEYNRSEGNRRAVMGQFFNAFHAAIGEEHTTKLQTMFKESLEGAGERHERQLKEAKIVMFGEEGTPSGASKDEQVEAFIQKSEELAEQLVAKEPKRAKKIEAAAQASLKAWK